VAREKGGGKCSTAIIDKVKRTKKKPCRRRKMGTEGKNMGKEVKNSAKEEAQCVRRHLGSYHLVETEEVIWGRKSNS